LTNHLTSELKAHTDNLPNMIYFAIQATSSIVNYTSFSCVALQVGMKLRLAWQQRMSQ